MGKKWVKSVTKSGNLPDFGIPGTAAEKRDRIQTVGIFFTKRLDDMQIYLFSDLRGIMTEAARQGHRRKLSHKMYLRDIGSV